jgi:hypothetical protein
VDLTPSFLGANPKCEAYGTNGVQQVGYGKSSGGQSSALVWSGTAASAINLQTFVPANLLGSIARTIDGFGNIFGNAGDASLTQHSVAWAPIFTQFTSPLTPIAAGAGNGATIPNPAPQGGGVGVTLTSTSGGNFQSTYRTETALALSAQTAPLNFTFAALNGQGQMWDLAYDGTINGGATVTFSYDPTLLPSDLDKNLLGIYHFTNGAWVPLAGSVNTSADTITVTTDSFSPFALAVVPEPSIALIPLVALLGVRHWVRPKRRPA